MTVISPPKPPPMPQPIGKIPVGPAASTFQLDMSPRPADENIGSLVLLYAVSGWGKTTCAANARDVFLITGPGERGYEMLLKSGRVPAVPRRNVESWQELLDTLATLATTKHDRKWVAVDSLGTMEELCRQHVCKTYFKGDWGKGGFQSFGDGDKRVAVEWGGFIARIEALAARGVSVMLLAHTAIDKFNNPDGADYNNYAPLTQTKAVQQRTVAAMNTVLFGQFLPVVTVGGNMAGKNIAEQKGKAADESPRVVRCEFRSSAIAKSQHGFPPTLDIESDDHTKTFETLNQYLKT